MIGGSEVESGWRCQNWGIIIQKRHVAGHNKKSTSVTAAFDSTRNIFNSFKINPLKTFYEFFDMFITERYFYY